MASSLKIIIKMWVRCVAAVRREIKALSINKVSMKIAVL